MTSFKELLQDVMSRNNRVNIAGSEKKKGRSIQDIVVMVVPLIKSLDIKMKI